MQRSGRNLPTLVEVRGVILIVEYGLEYLFGPYYVEERR
jgi:hypothetical protein